MDTETLLRNRVILLNDYPRCSYKKGSVFIKTFHPDNETFYWELLDHTNDMQFDWPERYPHLFRKLQWWEERAESELPEYVKFYEPLPIKESIWKVHEWRFGLKHPLIKTDCDIVWRELSIMDLPATEKEYFEYQKQPQKP